MLESPWIRYQKVHQECPAFREHPVPLLLLRHHHSLRNVETRIIGGITERMSHVKLSGARHDIRVLVPKTPFRGFQQPLLMNKEAESQANIKLKSPTND